MIKNGNKTYCFFGNALEYGIDDNLLFSFGECGEEQLIGLGKSNTIASISLSALNNWDLVVKNGSDIKVYLEKSKLDGKDSFDRNGNILYVAGEDFNGKTHEEIELLLNSSNNYVDGIDYVVYNPLNNIMVEDVEYVNVPIMFKLDDSYNYGGTLSQVWYEGNFVVNQIYLNDQNKSYEEDNTVKYLVSDNFLYPSIAEEYRADFNEAYNYNKGAYKDIEIFGVSGLDEDSNCKALHNILVGKFKDAKIDSLSPAKDEDIIDMSKIEITNSNLSISSAVTGTVSGLIDTSASINVNNVKFTVLHSVLLENGKSYNASIVLSNGTALVNLGINSTSVTYNGEDMSFDFNGTYVIDPIMAFNDDYVVGVVLTKTINESNVCITEAKTINCAQTNDVTFEEKNYVACNYALIKSETYTYGYSFTCVANGLVIVKKGVDEKAPVVTIDGLTFSAKGVGSLVLTEAITLKDLLAKIAVKDNLDGIIIVRIADIAVCFFDEEKDGADEDGAALDESFYVEDVLGTKWLSYTTPVGGFDYKFNVTDGAGNTSSVVIRVSIQE